MGRVVITACATRHTAPKWWAALLRAKPDKTLKVFQCSTPLPTRLLQRVQQHRSLQCHQKLRQQQFLKRREQALVLLCALPKVFPHKTKRVCSQHCSATIQQHGCLAQTAQALSARENATSELLPAKLPKCQLRRGQTLALFHDRER